MKNWKIWVSILVPVISLILLLVLHFVQPHLNYTLVELGIVFYFLLGGITGYLVSKAFCSRRVIKRL